MEQRSDEHRAGSTAEGPTSDLDLVEYVVIAVPELSSAVAVADALRTLVESAQIRVLDLVGVVVGFDGRSTVIEADLLPALATLDDVDGEVGGLLSEDDVLLAGSALPAGTSALVVVVEDRWASLLADAARQSGGRILGGERIPRHRLEQSRRAHPSGQTGGADP
jgi:Family of unknown function (DUF6325)